MTRKRIESFRAEGILEKRAIKHWFRSVKRKVIIGFAGHVREMRIKRVRCPKYKDLTSSDPNNVHRVVMKRFNF